MLSRQVIIWVPLVSIAAPSWFASGSCRRKKAELELAAQKLGMNVGALVWSVLHATHAIYIDADVQ